MRRVRKVLRLRTAGVGLNEIARRVGVAPSTVRLTLTRLASTGLSWPLPAEMTDSALEAALFAAAGTKQGHRRRTEPSWSEIHREFKRKHVTLAMLWNEYIERHPDGYRYARFCELYRSWASVAAGRFCEAAPGYQIHLCRACSPAAGTEIASPRSGEAISTCGTTPRRSARTSRGAACRCRSNCLACRRSPFSTRRSSELRCPSSRLCRFRRTSRCAACLRHW